MDTQKPLICHECYGKLTNYSGHCGHALEVFDSGRTSDVFTVALVRIEGEKA